MKRIVLVVLVIVLSFALFAGCAPSSGQSSSGYYAEGDYAVAPAAEAPAAEEPAEAPAPEKYEDKAETVTGEAGPAEDDAGSGMEFDNSLLEPDVDRKIIYEGNIEARTKNFDADIDKILAKLKELGGYQQDASVSGTPPKSWKDSGRSASMTLRVPSDKFDDFMNVLKGLGETISTSVHGTDISLQYFDTETRLNTLRTREARLQELLEQAAGVEDIIEIERELADVSYEIQMQETQLRDYDSLIDYSTVYMYLYEVNELESVAPSDKSLGERITTGFYDVLNALAVVGEGLLIFLIAGSPVLVPLAVIAVVIVLLVRRSRKKKAAKKSEPPAAS